MLGTIFGSHLPLVEFGDLEINGWRYCTLSKIKSTSLRRGRQVDSETTEVR